MGKKVYRSIVGIPIWLITGIAIFLIASVLYDLAVGDQTSFRVAVLVASSVLLVITIILHLIPTSFVMKTARNQMGG